MSISPFREDSYRSTQQVQPESKGRPSRGVHGRLQQLTSRVKSIALAAMSPIQSWGKLMSFFASLLSRGGKKPRSNALSNKKVFSLKMEKSTSTYKPVGIAKLDLTSPSLRKQASKYNENDLIPSAPPIGLMRQTEDVAGSDPTQVIKAVFEQSFPYRAVTRETYGGLSNSIEQLKQDLHRNEICILGKRINTIEEFTHALRNTPFVGCERALAEMLSQAGTAPTYNLMNQYATDQVNLLYPLEPQKIDVIFQNAFKPYHVDFSPTREGADADWALRGEMSFLPIALSDQFRGTLELAPRVTFEYSTQLPVVKARDALWSDVEFTHYMHLN